MNKELSGYGVTKVPKKGMDPSGLVYSIMNWIWGSIELMCPGTGFCVLSSG